MLTRALLDRILAEIPNKTIGLIGDLFLDRYLEIDDHLTEPSIETGLDAYQVVRVRSSPGALGTVMNNLVALGVGQIRPISLIGDDGEGYELRQELRKLPSVEASGVITFSGPRTPTYTKPMLHRMGELPRELNRLDIKNRRPTPANAEGQLIAKLRENWEQADAWIVLDQVSEINCGVITTAVRDCLAELGAKFPTKFVLADSREQIRLFRNMYLKPNDKEWGSQPVEPTTRAVFLTRGAEGIDLLHPDGSRDHAPAYPVQGPIDIVGAGDSCSAGIASAMVVGTTLLEAAAFGNLVASITVQQIGTTGTATPAQLRERWTQISGAPQ